MQTNVLQNKPPLTKKCKHFSTARKDRMNFDLSLMSSQTQQAPTDRCAARQNHIQLNGQNSQSANWDWGPPRLVGNIKVQLLSSSVHIIILKLADSRIGGQGDWLRKNQVSVIAVCVRGTHGGSVEFPCWLSYEKTISNKTFQSRI